MCLRGPRRAVARGRPGRVPGAPRLGLGCDRPGRDREECRDGALRCARRSRPRPLAGLACRGCVAAGGLALGRARGRLPARACAFAVGLHPQSRAPGDCSTFIVTSQTHAMLLATSGVRVNLEMQHSHCCNPHSCYAVGDERCEGGLFGDIYMAFDAVRMLSARCTR